MPKFSKLVTPPIGKFNLLPENEIDPNKDYYFCAFYPAWGFQDRQQAGNISEQLYNAIINGKKPIILKWNNSETAVSWEDGVTNDNATQDSKFQRNISVGDYFVGRVLSRNDGMNFATRDSGKQTIQGDPINYKEQEIQRRIVVNAEPDYFTASELRELASAEISTFKQRMFYICEELAGADVLYIEDMEVKFDEYRRIEYLRLTFASLGDKLRTVGALIDSHVRFSQPGMGYAYPLIGPDQVDNLTDFYDTDYEDIPGTKRVYISAARLKDDGVHGIAIEFDGAVALNSIQVFGRRVVPIKEATPNLRELDRLIPIFLQTDEVNTNFEKGRFNTSEVSEYQVMSGTVYHENWFTNWKEEYGFFFDPLKKRSSHSVFKALSDNEKIIGDTVNIVETKHSPDAWMKMYGRYMLQYNQWSDYTLNPTKDDISDDDWEVTFTGKNHTSYTNSVATFLNTQGLWNFSDDYVEVGGSKTKNRKGHAVAVATDISGALGGLIGIGVGAFAGGGKGAAVGSVIGSQATRAIAQVTKWLPDRMFTDQDIYRPGVIKSFLTPKNMLVDFTNKVGDYYETFSESVVPEYRTNQQKNVPLELFADSNDNFLSGVVNTKTYKCNFRFKLTDRFRLLSKNSSGKAIYGDAKESKIWMNGLYGFNGDNKFYTDQSIEGLQPEDSSLDFTGFIIEDIRIKALCKQPMKISFYDANGYIIWQTSRLTQAGYNGNIFDWLTTVDFSNITDDGDLFLNERYKYPDFEEKTVEDTLITNATKQTLADNADNWLKNESHIEMEKKSDDNLLEDWTVSLNDQWWSSTNSNRVLEINMGLTDQSKPIPLFDSQTWYGLKDDVVKKIKQVKWENPEEVDTLDKQLDFLRKAPYNYNYVRIEDFIQWRNECYINHASGSRSAICTKTTEYGFAVEEPQKQPHQEVQVPGPGGVGTSVVLGKNQFPPIGDYTNARKKNLVYKRTYSRSTGGRGTPRGHICDNAGTRDVDLQWKFDWAGAHKMHYKIDLSVDSNKAFIRANTLGLRIFLRMSTLEDYSGVGQRKFGKRIRVESVKLIKRS